MFTYKSDLFEMKENEEIFKEICDKLKQHPFESPWGMCFESEEENGGISYEVREINLPELHKTNLKTSAPSNELKESQSISLALAVEDQCKENSNEIDEIKLSELKDSLIMVQENSTVENIRGIEMLHTINLSQVPKLCTMLSSVFLSDTAVTFFLNAILTFEMPLSLSIASALVKHIVYPQVFEMKNTSRNLLVAVLSFSEIYPKAMVDEVIIPCIKRPSLEPLQLETLLKMTKTNLPGEYVSYCIKNILGQELAVENALTILQILIERKICVDNQLHEKLAWKVENWTSTCNKNMKFTKLLISILTVYGSQLTDQQICIYRDTIRSNETIMKKAAESVLKKLNKM